MSKSKLRFTKRTKKQLVALVIGLLLVVFGSQYSDKAGDVAGVSVDSRYQVTQVFDGDTIEVDMNGNKEKIRLIGVDTPETHDPRKAVQCFGRSASNFTSSLASNQRVRLESDPLSTNRDRYSRLLRYVYNEQDTLINAEIIRQGYGFAYTSFDFQKSAEFKNLEEEAKQQNRGLWGSCTPYKNKYGGFTSNDE